MGPGSDSDEPCDLGTQLGTSLTLFEFVICKVWSHSLAKGVAWKTNEKMSEKRRDGVWHEDVCDAISHLLSRVTFVESNRCGKRGRQVLVHLPRPPPRGMMTVPGPLSNSRGKTGLRELVRLAQDCSADSWQNWGHGLRATNSVLCFSYNNLLSPSV